MSHNTVPVRVLNLIEVDTHDLDPEDQACSICLEPMQIIGPHDIHNEPGAEILDCGHVFGLKCILRWLKLQTHCLLCRSTVTTSQRISHPGSMDLGCAGAREHKRCYTYAFDSPEGGHCLLGLCTNQNIARKFGLHEDKKSPKCQARSTVATQDDFSQFLDQYTLVPVLSGDERSRSDYDRHGKPTLVEIKQPSKVRRHVTCYISANATRRESLPGLHVTLGAT